MFCMESRATGGTRGERDGGGRLRSWTFKGVVAWSVCGACVVSLMACTSHEGQQGQPSSAELLQELENVTRENDLEALRSLVRHDVSGYEDAAKAFLSRCSSKSFSLTGAQVLSDADAHAAHATIPPGGHCAGEVLLLSEEGGSWLVVLGGRSNRPTSATQSPG